jgi:hypothetical protein
MGFTTLMGASLTLAAIQRTHMPNDEVHPLDGHVQAHSFESRQVTIDA